MRSRTTTRSRNRRLPRLWVLGAAVAGGGLLLAGSPARAGDFEDGFQGQLGRIAAYQVARFGQALFTVGYDPYAYDYRRHVRRAVHYDWRHARLQRRARRDLRDARRHREVDHFHPAGEPCELEVTARTRRDRGHDAWAYQRYERRR